MPCEIGLDHLGHQIFEGDRGFPAEPLPRLARITLQEVDLRGALQLCARHDMVVIIEAGMQNASSQNSRTLVVRPVATT